MLKVILLLKDNQGLKSNEIAEKMGVSEISIRRDMQKIKSLIEFKEATKTGGYFITSNLEYRLEKINICKK